MSRHGARLDAADKSWHLSSPAPYDPPLTYGGWNQSRALGIRIASLIHAREQALNEGSRTPPTERNNSTSTQDFATLDSIAESTADIGQKKTGTSKKRKHKIVVHSSPFQRCVQTSIAISAGIAQYQGSISDHGPKRSDSRSGKRPNEMHSASPRLHAVDSKPLESIPEPKDQSISPAAFRESLKDESKQDRATLRIDAFLGEWLSPDYFEFITPPPNSKMMVAGAKADLLRRAEDVEQFTPTSAAKASTGNLWGSRSGTISHPTSAESPLDTVKPLTHSLPRRDRSSSQSSAGSGRSSPFRPSLSTITAANAPKDGSGAGYAPPTPAYAVSPADPIPRGYVAHARDACVDIDYGWDSMRAPQVWGDGGEYGEEWSAMHKRFRKGVNEMVHWYCEHGTKNWAEGDDPHEAVPEAPVDGDDDVEEEIVVVMVTHGAGCNALIGALTNQPVLLDVGMASLTMAVRKDDDRKASTAGTSSPSSHSRTASPITGTMLPPDLVRRQSLNETSLSTSYEMKLVASSEHLRPGIDPANPPSLTLTSPYGNLSASQTVPQSRRRYNSSTSATNSPIDPNWNLGDMSGSGSGHRASVSSALGSIRRASVSNATLNRTSSMSAAGVGVAGASASPVLSPAAGGQTGLWGSPRLSAVANESNSNASSGRNSPGRELVLNFEDSPPSSRPSTSAGQATTKVEEVAVAASETNGRPGPDGLGISKGEKGESAAEEREMAKERACAIEVSKEVQGGDGVSALPTVAKEVPSGLSRKLSQHGLWGSAPRGAHERERGPKRRWTLQQE